MGDGVEIEFVNNESNPTMPDLRGQPLNACWRVRVKVRDYGTLGLEMTGCNATKEQSRMAAMRLAYEVKHKLEDELGFKGRDRIERERLEAQLREVRDCKESMMELMRATMTLDEINARGWPVPFERIKERERRLVEELGDLEVDDDG